MVISLMKKILIGLGIVLIIGTIVFFVFFNTGTLVFNPNPTTARIEINGLSITGPNKIKLPPDTYRLKVSSPGYIDYEKTIQLKSLQNLNLNVVMEKLPEPIKLEDNTIQYLTPGKDNNSLIYLANSGKTIFLLSNALDQKTKRTEPITPDIFSNLKNLIISPDNSLALLKKEGNTILYDFNRYDLLHQEQKTLSDTIGDIVYSPDGEKIIYYNETKEGERTLIRANKDNTGIERIFNFKTTNIFNPKISWSKDGLKLLILYKNLYLFDLYSKTLTNLTDSGIVLDAKFSPNSKEVIFSKIDDSNKISLYILSSFTNKNLRELTIKTTLDKINWIDENTIYASLPNLNDSNASDKIIKLNLETFEETNFQYSSNSGKFSPVSLTLLSDKNKLFFTNNNYLYMLDLKSTNY